MSCLHKYLPTSDEVRICQCGVIVMDVPVRGGGTVAWDGSMLQRRWLVSMFPLQMVAAHGFGWGIGEVHCCSLEGHSPLDELRREQEGQGGRRPRRGMGLAGDGTDAGPEGGVPC